MKQRVEISTYSLIMTILGLIFIVILIITGIRNSDSAWQPLILTSLIAVLCLAALFYMPTSISVNDKNLNIHRSLRIKSIPLDQIQSIALCAPTMAERRICSSGGWFGYWGWFIEPSIGKYFAYYGKASDCFLVTLTDGRKYVLGCKNPASIVDYISSRISR